MAAPPIQKNGGPGGLHTGYPWVHRDLRLNGYSVAGISTSVVFPAASVVFDVAQGLPFQVPIPNVLITHGHMDHASGLPYLISQKAMTGQTPPNIYMPPNLVKPMRQIMALYEGIDNHTYQYQFRAAEPGQDYPLAAPYFFRVFPTYHRVDSQGYTIYERKKKLREEFRHLDPRALGEMRKTGVVIEDHYSEALVSFTGDTKIDFLDGADAPRNSRVLVMEVTYWDEKKSVANAREWGHIHLDELIPRLEEIKSEKILLIHASARYSSAELHKILDARIPEHLKHKVDLFPRPM